MSGTVHKDLAEAGKWFDKAIARGSAEAQYTFGTMCLSGKGVTKDHTEALKWYHKAADQGHAKAQYSIGFMYANGLGVTKDHTEALKWFRKAADGGDADAQGIIGKMSRNGGTPPDKEPSASSNSPSSKHTLSMSDNGYAWKAASVSERRHLCESIAYSNYNYSRDDIANDYKWWYYNIDEIYNQPDVRSISIEMVAYGLISFHSINEQYNVSAESGQKLREKVVSCPTGVII